jgi:hypothetical protein
MSGSPYGCMAVLVAWWIFSHLGRFCNFEI